MNIISIDTYTDYVVYVDGAAKHWVSQDDFKHWEGKRYELPLLEIKRRFEHVYPQAVVAVK